MALITPEINATGRYQLKSPFSLNESMLYTCIAKRTFADCEKRGDDVYTRYYKSQGIVEGEDGFSLESERANDVLIITLRGQDGGFYWVPSSYIESWPTSADVQYYQYVMACSLGALPENFETHQVAAELEDVIRKLTGVTTVAVSVLLAPVTANPTAQEHLDMERTRLGNISVTGSVSEQNKAKDVEITKLREYITQLESILRKNDLY